LIRISLFKEAVKVIIYYWKNTKLPKDDSLKMALRYDNHPFIWWVSREGTAVQMGGQ
jgi:hypothetical protein